MKKVDIPKAEKSILKAFIELKIPEYIYGSELHGYDLMVYYEEFFNYAQILNDGNPIDTSLNSIGTNNSIIFNKGYEEVLNELCRNEDFNLKIYGHIYSS